MSIFDTQQSYFVENEFPSAAANIYYISTSHTHQQWCIKRWKPNDDDLYNLSDPKEGRQCLVRGLYTNRLLSRDVYSGIAQVFVNDNKEAFIEHFLENPPDILPEPKAGYEYALIMTRLEASWQLSNYFNPWQIQSIGGISFLAKEVARLQKELAVASQTHSIYTDSKAYVTSLQKKLALNCNLFQKALEQDKIRQNLFLPCDTIVPIMHAALEQLIPYLAVRYENGQVQHCHGDLKISNLWVRPFLNTIELLALDCIDFQPAFYFIDILSDAAMLAADIQAHCINYLLQSKEEREFQRDIYDIITEASLYADTFLDSYLETIHEQNPLARLLWEFFISEKALVCVFMWILYDKSLISKAQPTIGNCYFYTALFHAQRLQKLLSQYVSFPD